MPSYISFIPKHTETSLSARSVRGDKGTRDGSAKVVKSRAHPGVPHRSSFRRLPTQDDALSIGHLPTFLVLFTPATVWIPRSTAIGLYQENPSR